MKRFIPIFAFVLILSSVGAWTPRAYADGPLMRSLVPIGRNGLQGMATLTDIGSGQTKVDITAMTYASGAPGPASATAAINAGVCRDTSSLTFAYSLTPVSGTSSTTTSPVNQSLTTLNTYPGPPHYAVVVRDTSQNVISCVDVGMPSSFFPQIIATVPFRITTDPLTDGVLSQLLSIPNPLKVAIVVNGEPTGSVYSAYIRPGNCDKLDPVDPLAQLNDVVDGKSFTTLGQGDFLPEGLAVTVEEPGAKPGDYVACTETKPYTVAADLKPVNNSNVSGQVTLVAQTSSASTRVVISAPKELASEQVGPPLPLVPLGARIYRGTCSDPDPTTAYLLNPVVRGLSTTTPPVSINELTRGVTPYVVILSKSLSRPNAHVACAEIPYFGSGGGAPPTSPAGPLPGMPTTGNSTDFALLPLTLTALGLLTLGLGLGLTRRASRRKHFM